MEPQQYTIQILDKDESTDLVTSKQSCLIGRSLISDIRIHLPSVKEMHLEIDMKNKRVTAYGQDVRVNDVEVGVNMTVDYEYGDVVSLRNKRFVVHKNKEHREGRSLPLVVPAESAFGEQAPPPATPLKARFNMSPNRPRRSEDAAPGGAAEDAGRRDADEQDTMHGETETLPEESAEKGTRPSFFNATDSSIDNIITREKEIVDGEIKNNIEFDVSVLQTSVSAKSAKPMDLKEAVLEKAVLEDMIEGKQDAVDAKKTLQDLVDRGEIPSEPDASAGEEGAGETADAAEGIPPNTVKIRSEVHLVTEKAIISNETPVHAADPLEAPAEAAESGAAEPVPSGEAPHGDGMHVAVEKPEEQRKETPEDGAVCPDAHAPAAHSTEHLPVVEGAKEEAPAGGSGAEDGNGAAEASAKRGSVNNNLAESTPKEESEMAGTKYSSASRRVESLVDTLNREEERRAGMGVLAKKPRPADGAGEKSEAPQKKAASQKKEEGQSGKTGKSPEAEAGAARKGERSASKKKADARKKEPAPATKSKEKGATADEPQRKKIRLASAASQHDAVAPPKSRRKAAVPEKAPKTKKKAQETAAKKDAPKKKAQAAARKKKEGDAAEKKKAKKTSKK